MALKLLLISSSQSFTTGNRHFAECRKLCRVPKIGHSAKTGFAECHFSALGKMRLCQVFFLALGKDVFCRVPFFGTRQNASLPSAFFSSTRQRCILPSAFVLALGKEAFCRVHFFLPSANNFFKAIFEALNEFK